MKKVNFYTILEIIFVLTVIFVVFVPSYLDVDNTYMDLYKKYEKQYPKLSRPIFECAYFANNRLGVPTYIILAVMNSESEFNTKAVSSSKARGLMQILAKYHYKRRNPKRLHKPWFNTILGTRILKDYMKLAKGNLLLALKHYNAGPRGTYYNGPYINEIICNIVKSKPSIKAVELFPIRRKKTKLLVARIK
jgi:soluble lytic murein transglycosylase-like protein